MKLKEIWEAHGKGTRIRKVGDPLDAVHNLSRLLVETHCGKMGDVKWTIPLDIETNFEVVSLPKVDEVGHLATQITLLKEELKALTQIVLDLTRTQNRVLTPREKREHDGS